jgi:hypothetical protein
MKAMANISSAQSALAAGGWRPAKSLKCGVRWRINGVTAA